MLCCVTLACIGPLPRASRSGGNTAAPSTATLHMAAGKASPSESNSSAADLFVLSSGDPSLNVRSRDVSTEQGCLLYITISGSAPRGES